MHQQHFASTADVRFISINPVAATFSILTIVDIQVNAIKSSVPLYLAMRTTGQILPTPRLVNEAQGVGGRSGDS